jgi:hypothetical protein
MHMVAFPPSSTALAVPLWRFLTFTPYKGPGFPAALFFCRVSGPDDASQQKFVRRIADMHKKALKPAQGSTISLMADAFRGFSPSATALAVPLWRFLTFTPYKGPGFPAALFFCLKFAHRQKWTAFTSA